MPPEWTVSLGECNELLADKFDISRDRQDEFAAASHQAAAAAWEAGFYDDLVTSVDAPSGAVTRDEGIRPDSTPATLAKLKPSFRRPSRRHHHRRQRLPAQRRRRRRPPRLRRRAAGPPAPARPDRRPRRPRPGPAATSATPPSRPRTWRSPAPASAGTRSERSSSTRRSPSSRSSASTPGREGLRDPDSSTPRAAPSPSATRWAPPGPASLGTLAARLRERGERYGVAAICIGVGQGLAVVLGAPRRTDEHAVEDCGRRRPPTRPWPASRTAPPSWSAASGWPACRST